jgi:hypothetical protein
MSIAILRRRLRDRARVRRRATRSWLLRRKQRSSYNTLLKELHTEDPNEFRNYFRMDKTTFKMLLLEPFFRVYKISLQLFDKDDQKILIVTTDTVRVFFDKVFDGKL